MQISQTVSIKITSTYQPDLKSWITLKQMKTLTHKIVILISLILFSTCIVFAETSANENNKAKNQVPGPLRVPDYSDKNSNSTNKVKKNDNAKTNAKNKENNSIMLGKPLPLTTQSKTKLKQNKVSDEVTKKEIKSSQKKSDQDIIVGKPISLSHPYDEKKTTKTSSEQSKNTQKVKTKNKPQNSNSASTQNKKERLDKRPEKSKAEIIIGKPLPLNKSDRTKESRRSKKSRQISNSKSANSRTKSIAKKKSKNDIRKRRTRKVARWRRHYHCHRHSHRHGFGQRHTRHRHKHCHRHFHSTRNIKHRHRYHRVSMHYRIMHSKRHGGHRALRLKKMAAKKRRNISLSCQKQAKKRMTALKKKSCN